MDIHSGASVVSVPVTAKAVHKATLMKEDFVKLSFDADVDYKFKAGDWIEFGGMPYILADDYFPTMKDEATFSYELQFNAPWYNLDKIIFLFNTYHDGTIVKRESDWYITDTAQNILALIIRSTMDASRECPCVFNEILDCEPTVVKTFTFSSTSILSALNNLAKEFELEWWVTYEGGEYYLHFGECDNSITRNDDGGVVFSDGVRVKDQSKAAVLTAGGNVTKPSVSQKAGLKRKYWVFGSSRNIDQNATNDMEAGFVTSIVTKRLELAGNPQDKIEGSGEEVVIFDDIYPRSDYQITGVSSFEEVTDEVIGYDNGEPIYKKYNVYNLQIEGFSDYVFSLINNPEVDVQNIEDVIASGKPLSLKFITKEMSGQTVTPKLAGFEFELGATLVTDPQTGDQWYEFQIQHQEINGYIIPNENLIPESGDWVCIFNVKGAYIGGTNANDGQEELRNAFNKWYANKKKDVSYTIKPYANEDIDLGIGDAVVLNYKENSVVSRVFSFEKKIDILLAGLGCSDASYVISSYAKFGAVNQLKEDVKLLTASIANGTAGGGNIDASSISNAVATYGRRLFLSKVNDDTADGHIEFNQGITAKKDSHLQRTTFGTFNSGFLGSGACIDQYGAAEFKSIYSREYISTPEFRFNRITVTEGEQWNTNAFGIIDKVVHSGNNHYIYLRLEEGDLPSVEYGDICRGIYSNIGYSEENGVEGYDLRNQPEYDDCNFPTKPQFFTSYFRVLEEPVMTPEGWRFRYSLKDDYTPHPCKNMKFAQYGSFTNSERQASLYQTSIRHAYIQQLEGVNTWAIQPPNIVSRFGYLGDLTITLKDGEGGTYETQLEGNGLYVQKNVYFGNATIQLDPVTIEDLKDQLANYSVYLSAYTDVIKVDDAGNVIDGLWTVSGEAPNQSYNYRIYSAVTVRKGAVPLTIEEANVPIGKGKYKLFANGFGCSCKVENSTIFITGIDNVKDGVAGTEDDVNFDYDACRAMERVWVEIEVDCEGVGTLTQIMPVTVKHDPVPYIIADLTNENAGVSWLNSDGAYAGLPILTYINMAKGNEDLLVENLIVSTINGVEPLWENQGGLENGEYFYKGPTEGASQASPYAPWAGWEIRIRQQGMDEDRPLAASLRIISLPQDLPAVTEIILTCDTIYAGVRYERSLSLHIMRSVDIGIWEIVPTHQTINVDKNAYFNYSYVGVNVYFTGTNGRELLSELPSGLFLFYKTIEVIAETSGLETTYTTVESEEVELDNLSSEVRVDDPSYKDTIKSIVFILTDGLNVYDSEEVPVIREGLGGQGTTGPSGNGVQRVTDYYMRAKAGYTPTNDLTATPSSADVEIITGHPSGWIPNTFTAPNKTWPCVWHFTKYEYTKEADYLTAPSLIAKYSEDGNNIVGLHTYYLRTNEGNVNNIQRLDQGNTNWLEDEYVEPDNLTGDGHGHFVWRYFVFQYSKEINGSYYVYTPIEFVAKWVEDGMSFQCAYKVFPEKVNGQDYTPTLDNVSTGANMPTTDSVSWSATTTGLAVNEGYALWMTQRTYKGTDYQNWGSPVRISGYKGDTGADGTDIEFIYKQTNDGNPTSADKPTDFVNDTPWSGTDINGNPYSYDDDDFNPSKIANAVNQDLGWTDTPQGVSSEYKYEWCCQRTKAKGSEHWGGWVGPFIWSAYGDTGMDGDGMEYVFLLSNFQPRTPPSPTFSYTTAGGLQREMVWYGNVVEISQGVWRPEGWDEGEFVQWINGSYNTQGEWIPIGTTNTTIDNEAVTQTDYWSDDPISVSPAQPKEWVAVRKRINGQWGDFRTPALWATYSEAPVVEIIGGYWYINGNSTGVKAEGENGNGVELKGTRDFLTTQDDGYTSGKTTLQELTGMDVGDCYVVNSSRHLFFYNGVGSWPNNWTDLGEFKGADGISEFVHIAWATGMKYSNGAMLHPIVVINGVEQTNYFDVVQQSGVEYEWMGICTTNSEENPSHVDPSRNEDWDKYEWNHVKGHDGVNYERVYMRTKIFSKPLINENYTYTENGAQMDKTKDEYRPQVANRTGQISCQPASDQFTDDPVGVSETYPYEWMAERKKKFNSNTGKMEWSSFSSAALWAKYSFDGQQGDGVTDVVTFYLRTTMSQGVTYSTQGWSENYAEPDEDMPYLWKYSVSYVGDTAVGRTPCERIAVYSPIPNINLLDDTSFISVEAMEAWSQKGYVYNDPEADPSSEYYCGSGQEYNNFFGVATGTQGHNAFCGRFRGQGVGDGQNRYVVLLQQSILRDSIVKIEANKWYTLSYWVKGNAASQFTINLKGASNNNYVDTSAGVFVNGVQKNTSGIQFSHANNDYSNSWRKHIITFKTVAELPSVNCYIQWRMENRTEIHEVYICMPKLEVGRLATTYSDGQGSTKAFPRATEWVLGKQYYSGGLGESFIDMVKRGATSNHPNWYKCIKSHISTAENAPTGANGNIYWKQASWDGFIATGLLLAQAAFVENLGVGLLRTGKIGDRHVYMEHDIMQFFGTGEYPSIELATDLNGFGVLRFNDANGEPLYDLGPNGITEQVESRESTYSEVLLKEINDNTRIGGLVRILDNQIVPLASGSFTTYYKLKEGFARVNNVIKYNIAKLIAGSNAGRPSTWNGRIYDKKSYSDETLAASSVDNFSHFLPDGWYISQFSGPLNILVADENGFSWAFDFDNYSNGLSIGIRRAYFKESEIRSDSSRAKFYNEAGDGFLSFVDFINSTPTPTPTI